LLQPILASSMKHNYQTWSQNQVSPEFPTIVIESQISPRLPRVVTPAERNATPPRVPTRAFILSPIFFSQDNFLDMGSFNQARVLRNTHWTNMPMANAFIHSITGKEIEYMALMKDPPLGPFGKEVLETSWDALSKSSSTYRVHTHVYLLSLQTS
jgi:hypothetical protein